MNTRLIFTLLVLITLPLAGCIEGSDVAGSLQTGGDAESDNGGDATNSANQTTYVTETTIVNNYYNTTTNGTASAQQRTWYSTGGSFTYQWNDGQTAQSGQQRCVDYGPTYNQSTGDYEGVACRETAFPDQASDWNLSSCTSNGGFAVWTGLGYGNDEYVYRNAPICMLVFETIQTSSGEALLIYEATGQWSIRSTCDGVSSPTDYSTYSGSIFAVTNEFRIVQGSAMDCVHEIYKATSYSASTSISPSLWSVVYAIQETTVV
jgi:hypothetical protein